jgi:hypothetical protein
LAQYNATFTRGEESNVKAKRAADMKKQRMDLAAKYSWELDSLKK